MQSSPEHILATAGDGALEAWRTLDEHIRIVDVIGTRIAAQFGPPLRNFPQIVEFPLGDGHRLEDRAICCTAGDLEVDSSQFRKPGTHRNSPWCQVELRLNTIGEAQDRYNQWAAVEFDRLHSGPTESWVDERGNAHQKPRPRTVSGEVVRAALRHRAGSARRQPPAGPATGPPTRLPQVPTEGPPEGWGTVEEEPRRLKEAEMPSIAEVFVTVLPSDPVHTTSFYKNVLTPGPGGGRQNRRADARLPTPDGARVPAIRGVRLHDLWHTFALLKKPTETGTANVVWMTAKRARYRFFGGLVALVRSSPAC